jgi:hypothetical protein
MTAEDEEFNRIEMESRIKQEYIRAMRKTTREEKISRPAVYEVPANNRMIASHQDHVRRLMEELAIARVCIRELGDRLSRLEKTEQEPVAYLSNKRQRINIELKPQTFVEIPTVTDWEMPLYMKPPQRTWVGLTDEEVEGYWDWEDFQCGAGRSTILEMVKDIEAKLKEKNT